MSKRLRFFIFAVCIGLGALSLYPTFTWYVLTPDSGKEIAASNRTFIRERAGELAKQDTDTVLAMLQGQHEDEFANETYSSEGFVALRKQAEERFSNDQESTLAQNTPVHEVFTVFKDKDEVYQVLLNYYREQFLAEKRLKDRIINLGLDLSGGVSAVLQVEQEDLASRLDRSPTPSDLSEAIDRAMLVLQNRIDKFGVSEPSLRRLNDDSILVEIPGENEREQINSFLQGKGALRFILVDDDATEQLIALQRQDPTWTYTGTNTPDFIQAGTEIIEYVVRDSFGIDQHQRWIVVYEDVENYGVKGDYLQRAQVSTDQLTNRPLVNFQLDQDGAQTFAKLTGDYVNRSMAIALEDKVRAYATISAVISDGSAVIQGLSRDLANDLAIVLQTAALPVTLQIVDQELIGPTLGQTAIQQGIQAIIIGFALVVLFMFVYYRTAGMISVFTLLCNLFLLTAVLASFNFTITLTGIAAIILTVGMAVDANVLIYERIKEELRAGKTRRTAIENGYKKAFWTILDANITTSFNLGIDFSSGQNIIVALQEASSQEELEDLLSGFEQLRVVPYAEVAGQYNIKVASNEENREEIYQEVLRILEGKYSYSVLSNSFISSTISQNSLNNSVVVVGFALLLMLLYIWFRFKFQFAVAAILALMHDTFFIIGIIGAFQIEVTVSTLAAVLTIIGYSINDTIVIFDRIREGVATKKESSFTLITDSSINKTLSRTIITSLTTLLAVSAIFIATTGDIKSFALVLIIGVVEGTWSSIFIATPLLYVLGFSKKHVASSTQTLPVQSSTDHAEKNETAPLVQTDSARKEYIDRVKLEVQSRKKRKHR
ncbi:protein translocase subunit SecD-like [Ylistrum balloti]|uniref:protein translocase subunit SecD-like n=1 Tax=Ylistrum balloti TaxID=509963 RepID=UPI002905B057|nr:protein translocase subunit SecD-like [Ylistrum balloti]